MLPIALMSTENTIICTLKGFPFPQC